MFYRYLHLGAVQVVFNTFQATPSRKKQHPMSQELLFQKILHLKWLQPVAEAFHLSGWQLLRLGSVRFSSSLRTAWQGALRERCELSGQTGPSSSDLVFFGPRNSRSLQQPSNQSLSWLIFSLQPMETDSLNMFQPSCVSSLKGFDWLRKIARTSVNIGQCNPSLSSCGLQASTLGHPQRQTHLEGTWL